MRRLIVQEWISLDGFATDKNDKLDFFAPTVRDIYKDQYYLKWLNSIDCILFGKNTYKQFSVLWPERTGDMLSEKINTIETIVFSESLTHADHIMAKDFTRTFLVDQSPERVFKAVTSVRGWWQGLYDEEIIGETHKLDDEFTFRAGAGAHYSKQRLIEVVPDEKVVWLVTEGELSFVEKKDEWEGTKIIFDISRMGTKTQVRFTHEGLNPEVECYESCSSAWQMYLDQKFLPLVQS